MKRRNTFWNKFFDSNEFMREHRFQVSAEAFERLAVLVNLHALSVVFNLRVSFYQLNLICSQK
jgi:hypothetical protein